MITDSFVYSRAVQIAQAVATATDLKMTSGTEGLFRLIAHYNVVSNAGSDNQPRWTTDHDVSVQIATFTQSPTREQRCKAIRAQAAAFASDKPLAPKWDLIRTETVSNDELCEHEREQVAFARSCGDQYCDDRNVIYLITGGDQNDGYPVRWAPAAYAVQYAAAIGEAVSKAEAELAA